MWLKCLLICLTMKFPCLKSGPKIMHKVNKISWNTGKLQLYDMIYPKPFLFVPLPSKEKS